VTAIDAAALCSRPEPLTARFTNVRTAAGPGNSRSQSHTGQMDVRSIRVAVRMVIATAAFASCGGAPGRISPAHGSACHTRAGRLADTLYVKEELSDATPPRPRRPHLAPYPPSADGEFTIRFRGATYYAWGMPVRVAAQPGDDHKLIRIGQADSIPLFTLHVDAAHHLLIWAPITETCVLLPFKHESEMH
jgi:hypothetical protein